MEGLEARFFPKTSTGSNTSLASVPASDSLRHSSLMSAPIDFLSSGRDTSHAVSLTWPSECGVVYQASEP